MERIESLSPESKMSRFCMEAGFIRFVEVGQYFMTKDTGDFRQFRSVACRENTLPRDDPASQPKGWIQGNKRIAVFNTANMGLKFESGLWVKIIISLGSEYLMEQNKYVIDSKHNNKEIPANPHEDQTSQTSVKVIAARSKAKAKQQKREPVDTPSIKPMHERKWIDIEPSEPSFTAYEVSKKVINLLGHNQTVQWEDDGAIQFWRIKFHLRNQFSQVQHWSDERWKSCLAAGGGSKKKISVLL